MGQPGVPDAGPRERLRTGISAGSKARLAMIAGTLKKEPTYNPVPDKRYKPGTRLIRRWNGEVHQVTILKDGFSYKGRQFRSLSEIARAIMGTRWSGPHFFGLARRRPKEACGGGE